MSDTTQDRRADVLPSVLLLAAAVLVSAVPIVPPAWYRPIAAATVTMWFAVVLSRDREASSLTLFCAILAVGYVVNPWAFWPMALLVPLLAYGLIVVCVRSLRQPIVALPWGRFDRATAVLLVVTVLGSSAALVAWYILSQPNLDDARAMIPSWPIWALPLAGLGFAVVNALIEELIWRGILWELLTRAVRTPWVVIPLQAASFGLIHIGGFPRGWFGVAMAMLYGLFLGLMRYRAKGLGPPIIAHIFADATIFTILIVTLL
jgi:membrane protease YdiL (CAAX protease family)